MRSSDMTAVAASMWKKWTRGNEMDGADLHLKFRTVGKKKKRRISSISLSTWLVLPMMRSMNHRHCCRLLNTKQQA
jgi:hypothetical protein